jgi:lambda family phage portal protein
MASWLQNLGRIFSKSETPEVEAVTTVTGGGQAIRGGFSFGGEKFPGGLSSDGAPMQLDHRRLRQNARRQYHESPAAHALVNRKVETSIWTGLRAQPAPVVELLGITPEQGRAWAKNVGQRYHLYMASKQASRSELMTGYQQQQLTGLYRGRDGDLFYRFYYSKRPDLQSPLQMQLIDPEQIMGDAFTDTEGPWEIKDGIKRDAAGREIGYQVRIKKANGIYEYVDVPAMSRRNGRQIMGHVFRPEYAGQQRGYTPLHPIIQELAHLLDVTTSEVSRAIAQSQMFKQRIAQSTVSGTTTVSGTPLTPAEESAAVGISPLWEATITQPGKTFIDVLDGGEDIKFPTPTSPGATFDSFVESFWGNIGATKSMPPEIMRMKFGNNYSASRGVLLMYWLTLDIDRDEQVSDIEQPRYEAWLSEEIAAGRVSAPGWSDPRMKAAWLNASWYSLPLPHIDPLKEANAIDKFLQLSLTNQEREARAHNGSSAAENQSVNADLFPQTPLAPWVPGLGDSEPGEMPEDEEDE